MNTLHTGDAINVEANHRPGFARTVASDHVLAPGQALRIPLMMMDSVERAINEGRASAATFLHCRPMPRPSRASTAARARLPAPRPTWWRDSRTAICC
jgi:hypothetical protein